MENWGSYQYSPLAPQQIRLLRPLGNLNPDNLSFEIIHISREACLPYTAVSYTWGDSQPTKTIRLNGKLFRVRPNLLSCLYHLPHTRYKAKLGWTWIWVDAICINQQDDREKSEQVALMSRTYTDARIVSVWLGPPSVPGPEPFLDDMASSQEEYNGLDGAGDIFDDEYRHWYDNLDDLLNRPYWSRFWVIQEFLHARKIRYYCGDSATDSEHVHEMLASETETWDAGELLPDDFNQALNTAAKKYTASPLILARDRETFQKRGVSLYDHLIRHRHAKCNDRRDRVFALLSLVKGEEHTLLSRSLPNYALDADQVVVIALAHMMNYQCYDHEDINTSSDDIFQALGVEGGRAVRKRLLARAERFDYYADWTPVDVADAMAFDEYLREGDESGWISSVSKSLGLLAFLAITGALAGRYLRPK